MALINEFLKAKGLCDLTIKKFMDQLDQLSERDYCFMMFEGIGNNGHTAELHFNMEPYVIEPQ